MPSRAYDNALKRLRAICLALPEATEVQAWGHPTFRAGKKMFAAFGEGIEGQEGLSLGVKVGFDRQEELLQDALLPDALRSTPGLGLPTDRRQVRLGRGEGPAARSVPAGGPEAHAQGAGGAGVTEQIMPDAAPRP